MTRFVAVVLRKGTGALPADTKTIWCRVRESCTHGHDGHGRVNNVNGTARNPSVSCLFNQFATRGGAYYYMYTVASILNIVGDDIHRTLFNFI